MKHYTAPITEENLPKASEFILKLCKNNRAKNRAYNVVLPLCSVLFMFLSLIFTFGGIYSFSTADDAIIFEKLKPITEIWQFFAGLLIRDGLAWYYNLLICVAFVLLVPALISLCISVIFLLTAKAPEIPENATTTREKAMELHKVLSAKSKAINIDEEVLSRIFAGIYVAIMVAFTAFSVILTFDSSDTSDLPGLIIGALVVFAVAFFVHSYLFLLYYHMNTFACQSKSITECKDDIYEFWCSVDPEEAARNEERKREKARKEAERKANSQSSYAGMAYYEEAKKNAISNLQRHTYGCNLNEFQLSGIHLDDKEALKQYLSSTAPDDLKEAAIKKYNDYHLDYYID